MNSLFKKQAEYEVSSIQTEMEKMRMKHKSQRFIAHSAPLRGIYVVLGVIAFFIILTAFTFLPDNREVQNPSTDSLLAATDQEANVTLTATFVGDMMFGRGVQKQAAHYGYDSLFAYTKDYFSGFDLVLGNFNHPTTENEDEFEHAVNKATEGVDPDSVLAVKNAGFTGVSFVNNHAMDFSDETMHNTFELFKNAGLLHFGAGNNVDVVKQHHGFKVNNRNISLVGLSDLIPIGFTEDTDASGHLVADYFNEHCLNVVKSAVEKADITIVFIHWGVEYSSVTTEEQRRLGRSLVDAGADIVIGSHSHVLQPIEIYNNGVIFYSLGNFVYDQSWSRTKDSCIVRYALDDRGRSVFEIIPIRIDDATPAETYNPLFTRRIFNVLTSKLAEEKFLIENNRLYVHPSGIETE